MNYLLMPGALDQVDALQREIVALQPIDKEQQKIIDKKFRLEFNYNSNHIEGNTLTYGETKLLLIFGDTKGNHSIREYDEMRNHDVAFKLIDEWASDKERTLTEQNIKNLNKIILVEPFWKETSTPDGHLTKRLISIGNYKEFENHVLLPNGEKFLFASPTDTPILMQELIEWYRSEEDKLHPVTLAAMLHYKLVRIHPFDDGNGRVARLLMNYVLLRKGFPPVVIKSEDKANYLRVIHQADVEDYEPLIEYVAEQLIWSQQIILKGARGESIDEPGDFNKRLKFLQTRLNSDGTLEIRLTKSKHAVATAWDKAILPSLKKIEENLRPFNSMFKTSRQMILISPQTIGDPDTPTNLDDINGYLEARDSEIGKMYFDFEFNELRKSAKFSASVEIQIILHKNVYDLKATGLPEPISKRYDDIFKDMELEYLTDCIGNFIIASIEKHLDEKKP